MVECEYLDKESNIPICLLKQMDEHNRKKFMRRFRIREWKLMKEKCIHCPCVKLDIENRKIIINKFL